MTGNLLPPALIFIAAALLIPFLRGRTKAVYMLLISVVYFYHHGIFGHSVCPEGKRQPAQHVSAIVYAGATLGVAFAGDFLTLYLFLEVMAVSSTFLVIASRTDTSRKAGFRYIQVHLVGGLFL